MTKKNVAIFGGTFDPVHIGHFEIVKYFTDNNIVDEVWILPSYESPHKNIDNISSFEDRVNMLNIEFDNIPSVYINTYERDYYDEMKQKTYSYEVLNALKQKFSDSQFYFVVGFDSIKNIHTWHNYKDLIRDYCFYIFDRKDDEYKTKDQKIHYLNNLGKEDGINFNYKLFDTKITDISSTEIKELLLDFNDNIDKLNKYLNKDIIKYILDNKLYGT